MKTNEKSPGPTQLAEAQRLSHTAQLAIDNREYTRALTELEEALKLVEDKPDNRTRQQWARLQYQLGTVYIEQGEWSAADIALLACLDISREQEDGLLTTMTLVGLGQNAFKQGHFEDADDYLQEAIGLASIHSYEHELALAHLWLGAVAALNRHFEQAEKALQEAVAVASSAGDKSTEGRARNILGENARLHGNYDAAITHYNEALTVYESIDNRLGMTMVVHNLGHVMTMMEEIDSALEYYERSLAMAMEIDAQPAALEIIAAVASIAAKRGRYKKALALLGLVYANPAAPKEALHMFAEPTLAMLRKKISDSELKSGLAEGRKLNLQHLARNPDFDKL